MSQPDGLELTDRGNQIRLDATYLVRQVTDKSGKLRTILNDVSLSIEPVHDRYRTIRIPFAVRSVQPHRAQKNKSGSYPGLEPLPPIDAS